MTEIIEYLKIRYSPLSMIVYGSYADGTYSAYSDFDALVITDSHENSHDTTVFNGIPLDVFVCPANTFTQEFDCEEFLQLLDGQIILDTDGLAVGIIEKVRKYIAEQPPKTAEEIADALAWCRKMLLRSNRKDAEGMFRLHWLLTDSLEIFCDVTRIPYLGPKKSLKQMKERFPEAYRCYVNALGESSLETSRLWIDCLEACAQVS